MSYHSVPLWQSPLGEQEKADLHVDEAPIETRDETLFDNPQFQHYEETSNIQLFFDLFFVANLTTFTSRHEINSLEKLSSYIGFFCILWFTWCKVTLYDVRFATDSVVERIAHACHFGVMVGLAIVGPQFDPDSVTGGSFQQLSFILMASRIVLFIQYGLTAIFVWKYRRTRVPLMLVLASLGIAIILYLGLSFAFSRESAKNSYIAWYVVAVFEVGANIAIAGRWNIVSFQDTHLTERMTCLTLIVLGEGVIGLTARIALIEDYDFIFSRSTVGTIIAALLIIYLVYQLYFDSVQMEQFGTIRQQIWAFLHFPFHLAVVLLMEGINQFVIYRHVTEEIDSVFGPIDALPNDVSQLEYWTLLNSTFYDTVNVFWPKNNETEVISEVLNALELLDPTQNANVTTEKLTEASDTVLVELFKLVVEDYGFEPPQNVAGLSFDEQINAFLDIFTLIYCYFFISAGIVMIGIGILSWLSILPANRNWHHYIGIIANILLGTAVALFTTMVLTDAADNLTSSPWTLPLLVFVLFIALILNHVPTRSRARAKKVQ